MMQFNFLPIDMVSVGEKSIEEISALIGKDDLKDSAIVTSRSVAGNDFFRRAVEMLGDPRVFSGISQHSPIEEIDSIAGEIKGKNVKYLISIGGGSVIDSTKVIRSKTDTGIKQIAVPTTLSASEFSHIAGYTENGEKKGIRGKELTPRYIFLDPNATLETPTTLWRSSGIRAIDHAIEGTLGEGMVDLRVAFSRLSVEKMMANLEGNWTDRRLECQVASWYSYMDVYDSPMGYSHRIGKIIGARWNIPHGMTSCMTLPETLRYYSASPPPGMAKLASSITGEGDGSKAIESLAARLDSFIQELGLKKRFSDYGMKEEDLKYIEDKLGSADDLLIDHLRNML